MLEIEYAAFNLDLLSFLFEPVTLRDIVIESPMVVLPVADEGLLYGKDFGLFWSDAPLRVSGRLRKPDVSPDKGCGGPFLADADRDRGDRKCRLSGADPGGERSDER